MFKYLDKDNDNFLTYNDFCELCEEKRRQIDPFDSIIQKVKERQQQRSESQHEDMSSNLNSTYISKELQEYKERKLQNQNMKNTIHFINPHKRGNSRTSQSPKSVEWLRKQTFGTTPYSQNNDNSLSFGGGDIKCILNNQYERDYLEKARADDFKYQTSKGKKKVFNIRDYSETISSKKRMENNQRKLKIIN